VVVVRKSVLVDAESGRLHVAQEVGREAGRQLGRDDESARFPEEVIDTSDPRGSTAR
jgi:hypothetical protein